MSLIYGVEKYGSAEGGDAIFASTSIRKDIIFFVSILATIVPLLKISGDRITSSLSLTWWSYFFSSRYLLAVQGCTSLRPSLSTMTDNSKLCKACQSVISTDDLNVSIYNSDIDSSLADVPTIYPHHANDQDLRGSAQAGCPLCTILWDFFSDQEHSTKLKGASFVYGLHYDGDANLENLPWLLRIPYYRFNMRYEDSPPANINSALKLLADNITIYALGVESELIHN